MPLTLKMVASEVMMCGLKKVPVVGTAFEVVDAIRTSHAQTVIGDRLADIEDQLTRWEKRQRALVAEEIQTILGNLARPGIDGASLTEEIRNLRQIQEQGWNPNLFEGLMLNSSHMAELKRNPLHYGRILDDRDPVDPARGIHVILDADKTRVLELTPFAFSQLLADQARGIPNARMQLGGGIWAFPDGKVTTSPRFTNSLGMTLIRIEPGEFLMGSTRSQIELLLKRFPDTKREWFDAEPPQHPVAITRPFYLAVHQVTVGQYRRFVERSGHKADDGWRNPGFAQGEDHPVVNVSYDDAVAFLQWLNAQESGQSRGYRLPTEAEWEYVCRAGGEGVYGSGDDPAELDRVAWFSANSGGATHPVGQKEKNAFGLDGMLGNAWEWCDDWFDQKFYQSSPNENPRNIKKAPGRVIRGGGWNYDPRGCRPASRNRGMPEDRGTGLGFRVAAAQQ